MIYREHINRTIQVSWNREGGGEGVGVGSKGALCSSQ